MHLVFNDFYFKQDLRGNATSLKQAILKWYLI